MHKTDTMQALCRNARALADSASAKLFSADFQRTKIRRRIRLTAPALGTNWNYSCARWSQHL